MSLMHSREIAGPRILRKSTIIWIFLQRLSIQNHSKLSIVGELEKIRQISNLESQKISYRLGYIKRYSLINPRPIKSPSNSIRNN